MDRKKATKHTVSSKCSLRIKNIAVFTQSPTNLSPRSALTVTDRSGPFKQNKQFRSILNPSLAKTKPNAIYIYLHLC